MPVFIRVIYQDNGSSRSDERWAMDVTHIPCGQDGWAHLAAVIDCHDREIVGYEFALRKTVVSTRLTKPAPLDNQTIIAA